MRKLLAVLFLAAAVIVLSCNDDPIGPGTAPQASTLSADSSNAAAVFLSWTVCPDSYFESYRLYRSETSGVSSQDTTALGCLFSTTDDSTTTFTDSSITAGATYYYALITDGAGDFSSWSNEITVTIEEPLDIPDSVTVMIPLANPRDITFSPSGDYAYVSSYDGSVHVLSTSTHSVVATVDYVPHLDQNCMLPEGDYLYAIWYENTDRLYPSRVVVIDTSTWSIESTINMGQDAEGICTIPGMDRAYVCNSGEETIYVIDTATHERIHIINTGSYNTTNVCALPSGDYAYATRTGSHDIVMIDTSTNTIVDTINTYNSNPRSMAMLPSGEHMLVSSGINRVEVIRTSDNTVETTTLLTSYASDFGVMPDGDYAYIALSENRVGIIDTQEMDVVAYVEIPFTDGCRYAECSPTGDMVYLSGRYEDMILVLE